MDDNMGKLIEINDDTDKELLDILFNNSITVYEDIQGSKIWVNFSNDRFDIKLKSLNNDSINLIDLAYQNYYNYAITFFNSIDKRVLSLINKKWWFCFEYFPDEQPANIRYDKMPLNHLVLTAINKNGKYNYTIEEMREYARLINVDVLPVIYKGYLTDEMINILKCFLKTSKEDLNYVFDEQSFAFFFYKLLNPTLKSSFLMIDKFQTNMEKIIIQVDGAKYSFEIFNPLYKRVNDMCENTEFINTYTRIIVDFLTFCQSVNLMDIKLKGENKEEVYLYLMSMLFNEYVTEMKTDLMNYSFTIPEFFDKDKFKINIDLIPNKTTKEFIAESPKFAYIYKILIYSFSKEKHKKIGIFDDALLEIYNIFIRNINNIIIRYLKISIENKARDKGLVTFNDFNIIGYDTDASGNIYPDVYNKLEKERNVEKDKKKGIAHIYNHQNKKYNH